MKKPGKLTVIQPETPIAVEILAQSIVDIGEGMRRINSSRLNRHALLVLLKSASGQSMSSIGSVLNALENLEATYLKK